MNITNNSFDAFFALLRAGLWEQSVRLLPYEPLDFEALNQIANDQAVAGLLAAGFEHVEDRIMTKPEVLPSLVTAFSMEIRNESMNKAIESLVLKMREANIFTLLIKGQGVAQCYERPQWRASGDIDFLLDSWNYEKAKSLFSKEANSIEKERVYSKHIGMTIDSWAVELHGSFRCGLSSRIDRVLDAIQNETFTTGKVRSWRNGDSDVFLPEPDCDAVFIFTHFLNHFYKGGIGLRQICDWCRLLWTFRDSIDKSLLENRLRDMGLMSEWRAFATFAVKYLGMPIEAMPFYSDSKGLLSKARRICSFILKVGNFGQKRDMTYFNKYPYLIRKMISLGRRIGDLCRHAVIFPINSVKFLPNIVMKGLISAARKE